MKNRVEPSPNPSKVDADDSRRSSSEISSRNSGNSGGGDTDLGVGHRNLKKNGTPKKRVGFSSFDLHVKIIKSFFL